MHIKYSPFVNVSAVLGTPTIDEAGVVTLPATVNGKQATLTMSAREAAKLFRDLKTLDVETVARVLG